MTVYLAVLMLLGLAGGFFSGLLGLGGAILMVPLLLYVPPLLHLPVLDMKSVAAVSTFQVFASALSGAIAHRKRGAVSLPVLLYMGIPAAGAGFAGALFSQYVNARVLLAVFAGISTLATFLMLLPRKKETEAGGAQRAFVQADAVRFNRGLAAFLAAGIGFIGGMIGAPGAFIFVPVSIYILGIPMRITIGSTLGIVLLTAFTSMIGKIASGQMLWAIAFALVLGSVPAAQFGSRISHRAPVRTLHWMMTFIIAASSLKIWLDVLRAP
ncbi:MAG: sulfite exporter TauE/SafE family protein [Desulfitobacteriaceae bacterium]|nr:sulfite exporter TauE/SafE family protein [Desulfitobacteriaceae bacterium]MDI6879259.1 sulfite exporter TauE/SafE family protein [Desulfitobacteriaceae bacterium]MDI6913438.1 sulfite exporter TauE/SafE family protein [Desulfitobacteriaceae bacterium]